jgi:hypothetical protein
MQRGVQKFLEFRRDNLTLGGNTLAEPLPSELYDLLWAINLLVMRIQLH